MSRIYEALEKAKRQRKKAGKTLIGTFHNRPGEPEITEPPVEKKTLVRNLEKQGLFYRINPAIVSYHSSDSAISEEYKIMRTNFLSMTQEGKLERPIQSVVISSAHHKEGKSVTAVNFAVTLALDGQRNVLLVDCDLRRPSVGRLMGVKPRHDIVSVLAEGVSLEKAVLPTPLPRLNVIVCNSIPANPAELIGSPRMKKLMSSLRGMYDIIVYDSPPIMAVTDAVVLGAEADGIVMAIQARRTQRERIHDAEDLLRQAHANLLGFVLTDVRCYIPKYLNQFQYYTTYRYVKP